MARSNLVQIPHSTLSPEALRGVIEEYVTRAGTDYGARETPIEEKIADVQRQDFMSLGDHFIGNTGKVADGIADVI